MKADLTARRLAELKDCCTGMGVDFVDLRLLDEALTHSSFANERRNPDVRHNERLEFLGDAVLETIVSEKLFRDLPAWDEGSLTKARAYLVCEPTLARQAAALGLGRSLRLGRGEARSGGNERTSILADAFEAAIGAIYLDRGYDAAAAFVLSRLADDFALAAQGRELKDFKTLLQETAQREGEARLVYQVVEESGPAHHPRFVVTVEINGALLGTGIGRSKKEAEQQAAREALLRLSNG